MLRRLQLALASLLSLSAAGSAGAVSEASMETTTGLGNAGPATVVFALAGTLIVTLVFRPLFLQVIELACRRMGKRRIRAILLRHSHAVLDDFLVPGAYGGLTRVDHAVLLPAGLVCIQTKPYRGTVTGDPQDPQWSNSDSGQQRRFLNPLIQNAGRVRALQKIIGDVPVLGVVVFTGDVHFTTPLPNSVVHANELDSYIAKIAREPSVIEHWDTVWMTLKSAALTDEASRKDFGAQLSFS